MAAVCTVAPRSIYGETKTIEPVTLPPKTKNKDNKRDKNEHLFTQNSIPMANATDFCNTMESKVRDGLTSPAAGTCP
eukprot:369833-Amphidinium_carterae.1